jgi:DNA-binding MurR/RpiR family transcriptional regulator
MNHRNYLFNKFKDNAQNFSKSHKALAKFVLTNYQKVAFANIKQFAEQSGISQATIVRFVKALGFSGYPAFQKEIRRIVRADLKGNERFKISYAFREHDPIVFSSVLRKEIENLSYLQDTFDKNEFKKAISAMRDAKEIVIVGTRSTASLGYHFWSVLKKLRTKVTRITSITMETYEYINNLDQQCLIIVIGFPRYLRELAEILSFAKEKGIRTIAITDSPFSALVGEINLYTPAESISFMAFHCAPLVLINTIIHEFSLLDKESTLNALNSFERLAETRNLLISGYRRNHPIEWGDGMIPSETHKP